jgi:hypothetical protein
MVKKNRSVVNTNLHFDLLFQNRHAPYIVFNSLPEILDHAIPFYQVRFQNLVIAVMNIGIYQIDMVLRAF